MTTPADAIWTNLSNIPNSHVLHATAVAVDGKAAVLVGPSGVGKSVFALELMALGATCVTDDRVVLTTGAQGQGLIAQAPQQASSLIEARWVGLLPFEPAGPTPVVCCIDMRPREIDRLPQRKFITLLGQRVKLLHTPVQGHVPAAILHYLRAE